MFRLQFYVVALKGNNFLVRDERIMGKNGRRLTLEFDEDIASIDSKRRKFNLRKLQKLRLQATLRADLVLAKQQRSLSITSSLQVPTPSEDNILSSVSGPTRESLTSQGANAYQISTGTMDAFSSHQHVAVFPALNRACDSPGSKQTRDSSLSKRSGDLPVAANMRDFAVLKRARGRPGTVSGSPSSVSKAANDDFSPPKLIRDSGVSTRTSDFATSRRDRDSPTISFRESESPVSKQTSDRTAYIHLPEINIHSKQAEETRTSRGVIISDDISRGVMSVNPTQGVSGYNVVYSQHTDVVGERLSQGTSVLANRTLGDMAVSCEPLRVIPVNPKLTIDTGECITIFTLVIFL